MGSHLRQISRAVAELRRVNGRVVVAVECYTGLHDQEIIGQLSRSLQSDHFIHSREAFKSAEQIDQLVAPISAATIPSSDSTAR